MIQVDNLSKSYGKKMALDHITASIHDEHIFGLLGTNGAGKSTFLKILSGILKPDSGTVIIDDHPVFENELTKADICFLSDNPYFFPNATPHTMAHYYSLAYSQFDTIRFEELARQFHICLLYTSIRGGFSYSHFASLVCAVRGETGRLSQKSPQKILHVQL